MTWRSWLLIGGLGLSVGVNLYLFNQLKYPSLGFSPAHEPDDSSTVTSDKDVLSPGPKDILATVFGSPPDAITRERTLLLQNPQGVGQAQRQNWLKHNRDWLDTEHYAQAANFLQAYLKKYPRDIDFLILEAELVAKTGLLSDAIIQYYSLLNLPLDKAQSTEISNTIQKLTDNTIEQLKQAYSWDILAVFVEPLLQVAPTNRALILVLSQAYAQQQQVNLMENTLAALDYSDPDAMAIRKIIQGERTTREAPQLTQQSQGDKSATVISLSQHGDHYVVSAQLGGKNLNLLLDTGATTTAISGQVFNRLSHQTKNNFIGRFLVATASGNVLAPMYQFSSLKISHALVENITVMVLPMQGLEHADGLLGMNFLREFEFRLDQQNALLYLD